MPNSKWKVINNKYEVSLKLTIPKDVSQDIVDKWFTDSLDALILGIKIGYESDCEIKIKKLTEIK